MMKEFKPGDFTSVLDFYRTHGPITNPREQAHLLASLPDSVRELVRIVQGLFVHIFWADRYGLQLTDGQKEQVQTRYVSDMLAKIMELDSSPLQVARPYERRFVGNCRDFSVFLTALLRSKGIPARARCGFGRYFWPDRFEDHWIVEYWDGERWVSVDPQLDSLQKEVLRISFDSLDMPHEAFVRGGEAWQLARSGQEDPAKFGIFDMSGLWFIRGDFGRDLAAMLKVELLPWDCWGIIDMPEEMLTEADYAMLDELASLMAVEDLAMYDMYHADARLKVPAQINSYVGGELREITLREQA